jgi:hypothetical protein
VNDICKYCGVERVPQQYGLFRYFKDGVEGKYECIGKPEYSNLPPQLIERLPLTEVEAKLHDAVMVIALLVEEARTGSIGERALEIAERFMRAQRTIQL